MAPASGPIAASPNMPKPACASAFPAMLSLPPAISASGSSSSRRSRWSWSASATPLIPPATSTAWRGWWKRRSRRRRSEASPPYRVRAAFFQRARIGRAGVDALEERHRLGMTLLEAATRCGGFQRKTHLDVGGGEILAGEPRALAEFAFPERHVLLELRIDQRAQRLIGDFPHQRTQQRRGALRHQGEPKFQEQRRHRRALRIMQPVGVTQPLRGVGRRDQSAVAIGTEEIFDDRARLRDGVAVVGDDRRFAERMDRAQLLWRAHVGLTLIAHDLVRYAQFFQEPQHALRARIVEMMNRQHWRPPVCRVARRWCQSVEAKSRWKTPDILP